MTDNEIIKILTDYGTQCKPEVISAAISLINRQKEEIEKLKGSTIVSNIMESKRIKKEAKAEAYKEFAERLKEKLVDCYIVSDGEYCGFDCVDIHRTITNLLKEMAGETE